MKLRDYQEWAVDAIWQYFAQGGKGDPIVGLPTGTGKSLVIGAFIARVVQTYPGQRIMKLTHVKELIQQNLEKLQAFWPQAPVGVYSAGLKRRDTFFPITFAGIASVAKLASTFGHIDLILIDECHLISHNDETLYRAFIRALREINPHLKVIGFTATPYRLGQGLLTEGENALFTDICFDMTGLEAFNWFIAQGYLCKLVPKPMHTQFDLSQVGVHAGEYKQNQLQDAVDKEELTYRACQELVAYGRDRNMGLVFGAGVQHAINICRMLESMGESAVVVHSKMKEKDRDKAIEDWKAGKYKWAVNNGILTTGIDAPMCDIIGMMRPTKSASLWVQMLGRGTRPVYAEGYDLSTQEGRLAAILAGPKQNCLVLDFARNTENLGPINDPRKPKPKGKKGGGEPPFRLCEACGTYNHASARFCEHCGVEFPRELRIKTTASTTALIAEGGVETPKTEIFPVDKVVYNEHRKEGKPPTIQVSYYCGLRMFKEWVALEHEGFPSKKARDWWRARDRSGFVPSTTAQALAMINELPTPTHIRVWLNPKYPEIIAHDFSGCSFNDT